MKTRALLLLPFLLAPLLTVLLPGRASAAGPPPKSAATPPLDRAALAARSRRLLDSWRAYERYAWGHDGSSR